jgi:hypothetical protein
MGKFFNHYKSDRAVGFAHPYNERNPEPWHYTLGYRGYDLDVERYVSLWLVGILHGVLNCRFFGEARFKATIKRKRFSKQNAELTLCFCHSARVSRYPLWHGQKRVCAGTAH